jgi:hypothetical protein
MKCQFLGAECKKARSTAQRFKTILSYRNAQVSSHIQCKTAQRCAVLCLHFSVLLHYIFYCLFVLKAEDLRYCHRVNLLTKSLFYSATNSLTYLLAAGTDAAAFSVVFSTAFSTFFTALSACFAGAPFTSALAAAFAAAGTLAAVALGALAGTLAALVVALATALEAAVAAAAAFGAAACVAADAAGAVAVATAALALALAAGVCSAFANAAVIDNVVAMIVNAIFFMMNSYVDQMN